MCKAHIIDRKIYFTEKRESYHIRKLRCTVDLFFAIIATDSHIATEPHFYKFHFVLAMEPQSYRTRFGVRQLLSI